MKKFNFDKWVDEEDNVVNLHGYYQAVHQFIADEFGTTKEVVDFIRYIFWNRKTLLGNDKHYMKRNDVGIYLVKRYQQPKWAPRDATTKKNKRQLRRASKQTIAQAISLLANIDDKQYKFLVTFGHRGRKTR